MDNRFFQGTLATGLCLVITLCFLSIPAHSATWYVNDGDTTGDVFTTSAGTDTISDTQNSPDTPFLTIGRALQATSPGDTVAIDSGTFTEDVSFDTNNLKLLGADTTSTYIQGRINTSNGAGLEIRQLSVINSSGPGISLTTVDTPIIENVFIRNSNDEALSLTDLSGATVRNTVGTGAGLAGISFDNVDGSTLASSTAGNNNGPGVEFVDATNNQIIGNTIENNGQGGSASGFEITTSSFNNTFKNNISRSNTDHGFKVGTSSGNQFESNRALNNADNGFSLISSSDSSVLLYNLIANNSRHGIRISGTNNTRLIKNELKRNTEYQMSLNNATFKFQSKNNVIPSATNPDSLVINQSTTNLAMERNWWATTDTTVIDTGTVNTGGGNIDYIPLRLGKVDTAPGADTLAPAVPSSITTDTAFPGQVRIQWNDNTNNEEGTRYGDIPYQISGVRVYRSQNRNLADWKTVQIQQQGASDTDFIDTGIKTDTTYYYRFTAFDENAQYENESYFSRIFKVNVPSTGPAIYVNDDSTVGDIFTSNTGNDSNVGIAQHPVRTIGQALNLASSGDTIFVDAGTYSETVAIDTPNITMIGAGQSLTYLDGSTTGGTGVQVKANNFHVRELSIRHYGHDGVTVSGDNIRATNITLENNGDNGFQFTGGTSGYVAQATFDSNANSQVDFTGGNANTVQYSNIFPSPTHPDSGVTNTSGNPNPVVHNWWTTTDSSVINQHVSGNSDYIPHRLGIVDTGVNADTIAPAAPMLSVDTSVPQQLTLNWPDVTNDENGAPETGHEGYHIFKIEGVGDTPDWTQHLVTTLTPSDTQWIDTNVMKSQPYSYRMTSFDTAIPENQSYYSSVRSGTWFNRAPIPDTLTLTTQIDSPVGITVSGTDPDGDTMTFRLDQPPANGTVSGTLPSATYRPDTGFTGADTFTFVITDGEDTSVPGTVTIDVATNLNINIKKLKTTASETPAIANGKDTVGVQFIFENTGTGNGILLRDTDQLRINNSFGRSVADSFQVSLAGTDVVVPAGDTNIARWIIQAPNDPNPGDTTTELLGNFRTGLVPPRVDLEDAISTNIQTLNDTITNRRKVPFQIVSKPDTYSPTATADNLDNIVTTSQQITFRGGEPGGSPPQSMFDFSGVSASPGDSVFVVLQRGNVNPDEGINTLDTPTLDPNLNITSESDFENTVQQADQALRNSTVSGSLNFVDTGLFSISLWLEQVNGTYIGDPEELNEDVEITVGNVQLPDNVNQPDRLEVVKLVTGGSGPRWETIDTLDDISGNFDGDITFTVSSDETESLAGFSVFRIITSGFSTSGRADETVVYPNPFVPEDGNPSTGQYGTSDRSGIHFGAGPDRGFPSGTTIKIYTIKGQLVDKETTNSGGIIQWDAHTENGDPAASGVYIYRIQVPGDGDKVGKFAIVR